MRPSHVRAAALSAAAIGIVVLPIAVAQAHPSHSTASSTSQVDKNTSSLLKNVKPNELTSQLLTALGQLNNQPAASGAKVGATTTGAKQGGTAAKAPRSAENCGPARSAASALVTAQACVERQGNSSWARVYVSNASAVPQVVALDLSRTNRQIVQIQCLIAPHTEHGQCQTTPLADVSDVTQDAVAEILAQGAPVSAGVLHVESGDQS
jgi:hypothetical protein